MFGMKNDFDGPTMQVKLFNEFLEAVDLESFSLSRINAAIMSWQAVNLIKEQLRHKLIDVNDIDEGFVQNIVEDVLFFSGRIAEAKNYMKRNFEKAIDCKNTEIAKLKKQIKSRSKVKRLGL